MPSLQPVQRIVLSKVQTMIKSYGGGLRTVFYSTHDTKRTFHDYESALAYDQQLDQDADAFDHTKRYPTNFSYYNTSATNVPVQQGPHSLSHTSLAYRLNEALRELTGDNLDAVQRIVDAQIPSLDDFSRLLEIEAPLKMKDDQKKRMIDDYNLLLKQLAAVLKSKEAFDRDLAHELIMRLMQMHPYTAYGKGKETGKMNIKTKGEKPTDPFGKAFDKGAEKSFRNEEEYERFRQMRMLLWPQSERGSGGDDEKYADEEEDDDDASGSAAAPAAAAAAASTTTASGSGSKGSSKRKLSHARGRKARLRVVREQGEDDDTLSSVKDAMDNSILDWEGNLLVVDGSQWTCYVRCVLHGLGAITHYENVINRIRSANIEMSQGVTIGSQQETEIQRIIIEVTQSQYYVQATAAATGDQDTSAIQVGTRIHLVLTGAHFSLFRPNQ